MKAIAVVPQKEGQWLLTAARSCAVLVAMGAAAAPPLVGVASVLMIALFFALPDWRGRMALLRDQPLAWGLAALLAVLVLAFFYALLAGVAPRSATAALLDWRHLLLVPLALALFDDRASQRRFALAFVGFAVLGAVAALVALYVGYSRNALFPGIVLRNPVTQSLTFTAGALFAFWVAIEHERLARWMRIALALTGLALLAVLVFLQTGRSGFLALVVAATVSLLLLLRGRALLVGLLAIPLVATAMVAASPRLQERFSMGMMELRNAEKLPEYSSMGIRVIIWQTSAELIAQRPLLGYGLGGFPAAYEKRIGEKYREGWKSQPIGDPHNQYMFLWAEAGLPGLLAFGAFLIGAWRQRTRSPYAALGLGLLAAWCATSVFSSHFQTFNEGHLIAVFLGVFLARAPADQASAASAAASTSA